MKKILLGSVVAVLVFSGCAEDTKDKDTKNSNQIVTKEEVTQKLDNNTVVQSTNKVAENTKVIKETKIEKEAPNKVEEKSENSEEIVVVTPDGETLFKTCASCHGQKGEKEALGKSQIITGWDKDRFINAMKGYKDGTYGGVMKNIMKSQVETKTDEEIDILANYVSNLK